MTESWTTLRDGAATASGAERDRGARLASMRLSDLSIRIPVLATVMGLMLVLLGVMPYEPLRDTSVLFGSTIVSKCSPCVHEVN